jgi:flagellar basal-body rod modification protein FlgD
LDSIGEDMTMIDANNFIDNINATQSSAAVVKEKSDNTIGKNEFLTMLVAQLKNQDPLDPMSNDDFAVNLAQFSQLEQLIDINGKLEKANNASGTESASSMASYLGHEVLLNSRTTTVSNGNAGSISFDLSQDAKDVSVELVNSNGTTVATVNFENLKAGQCSVDLGEVGIPDGEYLMNITATTLNGAQLTPTAYSSGIVDGFIPGDSPTLLVNGSEVSLDKIKEVRLAKTNA